MGKRDFDQVGSPYHGSPEPYSSGPSKKQKQSGKSKNRPNEGSSQWARKRARNIDRLLQRNQDLPANVRNDLERELAAHKTTVTDKAFQKKRSAMIGKYHMVRFFGKWFEMETPVVAGCLYAGYRTQEGHATSEAGPEEARTKQLPGGDRGTKATPTHC